jgi:hypothetical protein
LTLDEELVAACEELCLELEVGLAADEEGVKYESDDGVEQGERPGRRA